MLRSLIDLYRSLAQSWEAKGVKTMRFFLEPVSLAINFAMTQGYEQFVMVGCPHLILITLT